MALDQWTTRRSLLILTRVMKRILLILCMALLCLPVRADADGKRILDNLFRAGVQAVQTTLQQGQENTEAPDANAAPADPSGALGRVLAESLKKSASSLKEQYKEEGRAYARELGDMLAERIVHSPRVHSAITTLQAFCWVIIAYLVLVTLLLLVGLQRLRANDRRILELLHELKRKESDTP